MRTLAKKIANSRFAVLPERFIFRPAVLATYRHLLQSQWWPRERIQAYQLEKIRRLVAHAYEKSPFYRNRFDSIGLEPGDIRSFEDFRQIPPLTKQEIREHLGDLQASDLETRRPILTHTGGTTGAPLKLYRCRATADVREAVEWRTYQWAGFHFRDPKLNAFAGRALDDSGEPWYEDPKLRTTSVRINDTDQATFELFARLYRARKPRLLIGILEFYRLLGRWLEEQGIDDIKVAAMFSQGESITETDRENIQRWFGCRIYDYYGMRENAVSAGDCTGGSMHINSEFVYMEFETDGRPAKSGEQAEIIGTSLTNYAVPLIRYRTEDIGEWLDHACPCGRHLPVMKIVGGRARDFVMTPNRAVYICHHVSNLIALAPGIEAIQFYQPDQQRLIVRVQAETPLREDNLRTISEATAAIVHGELRITVEQVETIRRTARGKYRFVISDIDQSL